MLSKKFINELEKMIRHIVKLYEEGQGIGSYSIDYRIDETNVHYPTTINDSVGQIVMYKYSIAYNGEKIINFYLKTRDIMETVKYLSNETEQLLKKKNKW